MAFDPSSIKLDGFDPDNVIDGAAPAKAEQGDYLRGLKKYVPQMQEMYGAGKALVGKAIDSEGMVQAGIETMQDANRKVEEIGSKPTDEFTNVKDVGGAIDWAQHGLGQVTGNLAESLVAAGAGTLLGGALGNPITAGVGGATGFVGKKIIKDALLDEAKKIAVDQGEGAAKKFVAKEIGKDVGQNAAIAGMAGFHGVGETGSRAFQEAKYDPNQVELGQVLPRAAGHAAAEFLGDKILLGGMLGKGAYRAAGEGAYPLVKTVAGNMAIVAGKEIPVELVQTVLERDAAKLELMSPEARDEYINTAAQTMLFGIAGAPAGVRSYMAKPPQQTKPMTQEEAAADLTASNTELAGAKAAHDALPSDVPQIGYNGKPDAIIVPNQSGGTTEINRNDGALSAAVVDTGITGQMLDNGTTLVPFASRDAAQSAIDQREDADRLTVVQHPRVSGRFAMVPKDRLTLEAQDQAAMRRQQLEEEDGNAPQLDEAGNQGRGSVTGGGGGNASTVSGIGAGSGDAAASSVPGRGTSMAMGAADATESALALESAQSELAPQSAQPVSSMPGVQARNAERIAAARIAAEARGTALVDEEAAAANTSPSEAQIAAGNYKKGHIKVGPLDISVENPIGSTRSGKEGKKSWTTTMRAHYGYIKRTVGADGDQVDVFVKEGTPADHSGTVYVIDQFNPKTGRFDEHKGMIGYSSQADAARAYDDHFGDKSGPKRRKAVIGMPAATFARWAKEGDTTSPISQSGRTADEAQAEIEKSTGKLSPSRQKAAGRDPYAVAQEANDRRSGRTTGMPEQAPDNAAVARTIGATDFEEVKDEALPDAKDTDAPGTLTKQGAKSLRMLAKLFGKKIVIFKTDADADGFYINGNTIYIKSDSSVSQLRVLGHEMMHALRRQAPKVYQQMLDAVSELLTDAELKAFYADYNKGKTMPAEMSAEQRDALVEEWMADLGGNRWGEAEFWSSMFAKLEEQHGTTLAKKIINQLRMAVVKVINSLLRTIRGGTMFAVDRRMADNLEKIREAMAQGFADYAKAVKDKQIFEDGAGEAKFARKAAPKLTKKELKEIADREATRIFEGKTVEQSNPLDDEQWQEVRRIALQKLKPMQRAAALKAERDYLELQREAELLAEKYKERAAEVLSRVKENGSSSVSIMDGSQPATVDGTGKLVRGKPKVLTIDIGRFFLGRQQKIDISTEAGRRAAGIAMAREAAYALTQDGHAVGWYDRKVREALAISALVHPELLTSKRAQVVFKMIAAITSNGQAVRENFILANIAYSNFKNGVPLESVLGEGGGARRGAMIKSLIKLRNMIDDHGAERVGEIMLMPLTVKEIQNQFGLKVSGEHMATVLPAAVGLGGPKIGSFYANLSGHFDSLTMDMWFMRTAGRITGNIVVMPKTVGANLNELASILPESGEWNGVDVNTLRAEIDAYNMLDEDEQADVETVSETVPETILYARAQLQKFSAFDANGKTFTQKTLQNENARRIVSALDSTNDSPGNGAERNNLRGVVEVARNLLARSGIDLNVADMQAVLWYYEKNLFTKLGANNASAKPWDYASAARFGVGRTLGLVDVKSSKRAGQVGPGEQPVSGGVPEEGQRLGEDAGQVKKSRSRILFEVAPDPNDARLSAVWKSLSGADKQDISKSVASRLIPKILSHFGATGKVFEQIGGYQGESNPSFTILLESGDPDAIAKASGFILSQDMMIAVSDKPFPGGVKTGAVTIEIGKDDPAAVYAMIYDKVKAAEGHTTVNGQMIILNNPDFGITTEELGRQVDEALGGWYDAFGDDGIYAEFPKSKDYGYDIQDAQGAASGSPDSQWAGGLRSEANQQLESELRRRGIKLSPARSDAAGNERAGGRNAADGIAIYGQASPGSVAAQGFHHSGAERKQLDGRYYGTGAKGRESDRVFAAADKRLRERIYFYVDAGKGITPEQGVGAHGHTVNLNNLYDPDRDTFVQAKIQRGLDNEAWLNAFESAVIDSGFDGYIRDFGTQRAAVLIGRHSVPVTYTGTGKQTGAVNAETTQKPARRTDLPMGKMTGAEWKKLEPRATDLEDGKMYYRDDIKFSKAKEQTKTPEFKAWFGEWDHPKAFTSKFPADLTPPSMAMDWEENKPLVLFHATNNDFNEFEVGRESITSTTFGPVETRRHAIFTTPDSNFAESYLKKGGGQNVMPVYMDIKAPMDLRNNGAWNYADELVENGFDDYRWPNRSDTEMWEMFDDEMGEAFVAAAKKAGYDGAIMFEVDDNDKMVEVYVAFDQTQIKSAIGNRGTFDGSNPDIRYSPPRWYFSPLEKAFESAPDKVFGQAAQVKLWLAGNKSKLGLKDDEIFWTGINDWLDMQGKQKVSKADVLGYLAGSGVQVQEVMKGVPGYNENDPQLPVGSGLDVINATDGATGYEVTARNGRVIGRGKTEADAIADAYSGNPEYWEGAEATKFGQYTLPGGENYRELLLTLPDTARDQQKAIYDQITDLETPYLKRGDDLPANVVEKRNALKAQLAELSGKLKDTYRSTHWDEKNILAHIRMNDRTDAGGAKTLFIEEIQSDWNQEGRKKGFVSEGKLPDGWSVEEVKVGPYSTATKWAVFDNSNTQVGLYADTKEEAIASATKRNGFTGGVPAGPFVTDTKATVALAVKRIMAYAAANGYDKVAFINGEQSADRYDLSKQVDSIAWRLNGRSGGDKIVTVEMPQGTTELFINKEGRIGRTGRLLSDANGKQLDDVIGKEITEKVLSEDEGNLSGDGLKIGGTGMKTFYDRIVPQVVSDQLKKVGGKMELSVIGQPDPVKDINQFLGRWKSSSEALNAVVNNGVISARKNNQILDAVVESIPVNVVNVLSSNGISAKDFASNPKVYFDHLPANVRLAVANGFADALSLVGARARAGLRSAYEAGLDKEILPALKASDLSLDESIRIGGPSVFNQPGTRGSHGFTASSSQGTGSRAEPASFSRGLRGDEITPAELANFVKWHRGISSNYSGDDSILLQNSFAVTPKMSEPLPLFSPRRQTETPEFKALSRLFGSSSMPRGVEPNLYQSFVDGLKTDAKSIADLLESRAFISHGYRGLDVPARRKMLGYVISASHNDEVLRRVIASIPVDMMNLLSEKKLSAETILRNKAMLENVFAVDGKPFVSLGVNVSDAIGTLIREVADAAAKVSSGLADGALENDSAYSAGFGDSVLGGHDNTRSSSGFGDYNIGGKFDPANPDIRRSTSRIIGASTRPYSQDHTDFFKRVGRTIDEPSFLEKLGAMRSDFGKKMATGIVDQFRGLKDLGPGGMQAYMLSRLSKGASGAFDALLHHGKLRLRDNVYDADTSGGFVDRLGIPLNGELEDFLWWVAANRAEALSAQGKENLFSPQDIAAGKSLATGQTTFDYQLPGGATTRNRALIYKDALRIFNEFNKNILDVTEQSGLIDGASRPYWESQFYVPFYRVSEEDNEFIGSNIKSGLVRQRAFQKLKGGTDKLNSDLLSNTLLNWSHLIDASAKNRAAKASLQASEQAGVAQKVAPDMASYAQSNGALLPPGTKKTVWYMDNGQKQEYKVTDPFVMIAITGLEYAGMRNPIMDTLSKFKHWLTVGVTASPAFKVRNLIRDSLQAIGASELGYNPVTNVVKGFKASNRASQDYVSALAGGGLIRFGTMLEGSESARVRQLIKSGVKDSTILNSEGKLQQFYDRYLEPTVTAYNEIGNRGEEINRMALYKQLVAQGRSHAEASLLARDLMDFSMQGSFNTIRFLTQIVPFMNARLQGMYKLSRAAKDDPRKLAIVTGATALFSIALMMASEDDDDWKKREDWDRDNFWWFKIGDTAWRIPKPFEVGAVATMAERSVELMLNDEMNGERYRKILKSLLLNNLSMNPVPQAIKPIVDLYANKDSFTGRPIENMSMQRLDPTERYTASTSLPARAVSASIGGALSPVQVDHVVRGYFSWLGTFVVGGADMLSRAASNEPTRPTMDYLKFATQGIGQEVGSGGSRYITQMYDQANELEQAHATWNHLKREGRIEEAREYMAEHADELKRYKPLAKVKEMESKLNERIRAIERSNIDPDQKKTQIDNVKKMKDQVARRVAPGVD